MKTLVTGATGLVGANLVRELLKNNIEVRVMVREKSDTRSIDGLEIEKVFGDIRDSRAVTAALKGCNTFYQTAGLYVSSAPEKEFYDINVEGVKTALNAALRTGVEKVVHTSSVVAVACGGSAENPITEEWKFNMWDLGPYVRTKYQGEQAALEIGKKGLPLVVVNPAAVIGIYDIKPTPSGQILINILKEKMPGYPDGDIYYVDVEDVARGHILAARKGKIGERYILGNANLTYKQLFAMVGEIAGITPPERKFSRGTLLTLGYMLQFLSIFTRKPPLIDPATARFATTRAYFSCDKAIKELGYTQTPIKTTLAKTINWFKDNGYLKK